MFALVDCNNFFVSCERVFNPKLENEPIVVLSNNDGCIIARSEEAKSLGIEMGIPYFQVKHIIQKYSVFVLSSNFKLYANMSRRVFETLKEFTHNLEEYSIDEAFLDFSGMKNLNLENYAIKIRAIVKRNTGIPVSIGIGKSKTLAKMANFHAKKLEKIIYLKGSEEKLFKETPTGKIWGVGKKNLLKLQSLGIANAFDLQTIKPWLSKSFDSPLMKTIYELKGYSCSNIEKSTPPKNIISSRSFYQQTECLKIIKGNLSNYTAKACQKLRKHHSVTNQITIYLKSKSDRIRKEISYDFEPTDDTRIITKFALKCLERIYIENKLYYKAGIMLHNIQNKYLKKSTLSLIPKFEQNVKAMQAIDQINAKYRSKKIYLASENILRIKRSSKSEMKSSAFDRLLEVR